MFNLDTFVDNERSGEGGITVVNSNEMQGSFDPGLRRPYIETDRHIIVNGKQYDNPYYGKVCVPVFAGYEQKRDANGQIIRNSAGQPQLIRRVKPQLVSERVANGLPVLHVDNATTLTKDAWIRMDAAIQQAVRPRLRAWADLRASSTYGGFDGMSTPILERELINDPGEAVVDMEGLAEGRNFAPDYSRQGLPLPITHSDFHMSSRFLQVSRKGGQPEDMTRAEIAGRRVAELIEKTTIGTVAGATYGVSSSYLQTSKVYGYRTHPARITKTDLTASATILTNIATTGGTTMLTEVIEMINAASAKNYHGPFILYVSTAYDDLLDYDFKAESDKTIRSRIMELDKIRDIRRLDYLTGDEMIMVQMTPDVAQAVNGLEITTVQWDTKGGMQLNFKVMAIQVPYIRSAFLTTTTGNAKVETTGIVHATTS